MIQSVSIVASFIGVLSIYRPQAMRIAKAVHANACVLELCSNRHSALNTHLLETSIII
jgi:hypothetical protein